MDTENNSELTCEEMKYVTDEPGDVNDVIFIPETIDLTHFKNIIDSSSGDNIQNLLEPILSPYINSINPRRNKFSTCSKNEMYRHKIYKVKMNRKQKREEEEELIKNNNLTKDNITI